jgi:hypothetical protein
MSQQLYERSSRTISVRDIPPDVLAVIEAHATERMLGSVAKAIACVATHSVSLEKPNFLARLGGKTTGAEHHTFAVLTSSTLIVATSGAQQGITVLSTRLADVDLIGQISPRFAIDSSIQVQARWGDRGVASYSVGLGDDPAGRAFHDSLRAAVTTAKKRTV